MIHTYSQEQTDRQKDMYKQTTCKLSLTCQAIHRGCEGEVRIGEGGAYKVTSVCAHIPSLVVSVDGEVKPHQLGEGWVVVTQHGREVSGPVLLRVYAANLKWVWSEL